MAYVFARTVRYFIQYNVVGELGCRGRGNQCRWGTFVARAMDTFCGPDVEYVCGSGYGHVLLGGHGRHSAGRRLGVVPFLMCSFVPITDTRGSGSCARTSLVECPLSLLF